MRNIELLNKIIDDKYLDEGGKIISDYKFNITIPELKIQNSKLIGNPDDKFETFLFLPEGRGRKYEGGLRTRGYFKFNYVWRKDDGSKGKWWIADYEDNPLLPTQGELQRQIDDYIKAISSKQTIAQNPKFDKLPLISVITVVLNGEKYLEQTIQSVINQTYPNIEYIIIDGGSTDGTLDIIKKYEDYIDYCVSEKDEGIYDAMNKGTLVSTGSLLFYVGAENEITKDGFFKIWVHNNKTFLDRELIILPVIVDKKTTARKIAMPDISKPPFIVNHQGMIFYLKGLKDIGLYRLDYHIHSDFELYLRYISKFGSIFFEEPVCIFYTGGISSNGEHFLKSIKEMNSIFIMYGGNRFSIRYMKMIARPLWYFIKRIKNKFHSKDKKGCKSSEIL